MHKIKLESDHYQLIQEALLTSIDIKRSAVIRNQNKIPETERQYADALAKLSDTVTCGSLDKNIFTWLKDQIRHTPGLRDQELGMRVIQICDVCAADRYMDYISARFSATKFGQLFYQEPA